MTNVIVIDDNDLVRQATCAALKRWYKVVSFENPHDALLHLQAVDDAVVVCDYDMPLLTGIQVYERLSKKLQSRFILHTGNDEAQSPSGHLLRKPCGVQELRAAVAAVETT